MPTVPGARVYTAGLLQDTPQETAARSASNAVATDVSSTPLAWDAMTEPNVVLVASSTLAAATLGVPSPNAGHAIDGGALGELYK